MRCQLTIRRHRDLILVVQIEWRRSGKGVLCRDNGVLCGQTWRLADLGAKQALLIAGLGWGNMPAHLIEDDLARGRLKIIQPADFDAGTAKLVMSGAYLADRQLGRQAAG